MQLSNTLGEMSCVYEAFLDAGLPVENKWITKGVMSDVLFVILEKHGYEIHKKTEDDLPFRVSLQSDESFFVMRIWDDGTHHLEHHDGLDVVNTYNSSSICMIAKSQ